MAHINYVIIHSKSTHLDRYLQLQATVNTVRSQVAPPLLITSVCHTHCATLLRSAMLPECVRWESITTLISVYLYVVIYFVNKAQLDSADYCSVAREAAAGCLLRTVRPGQCQRWQGSVSPHPNHTITTALDTTKSNLNLTLIFSLTLYYVTLYLCIYHIISMYCVLS